MTLATMGIVAGLAREISNLQSVPVMSPTFVSIFGGGRLFGVPSLVFWTVAALVVGYVIYRESRFGAHVRAVGDNPRAALVSGIRVARVRLAVLVLSGACAGLAGLLYAGRIQAARYTLGETDLMTVIAAVIVGGTHKVSGARAAIERAGATLMFLPSYSPDFNPIEQVFAKLKAFLRKAAARTLDALETAIASALDAFPPQECANYFTNSGYEPD